MNFTLIQNIEMEIMQENRKGSNYNVKSWTCMEKRERLICAHFNIQNNAVVAFSTNNNSSNVRVHHGVQFDEHASIFLMCSYSNELERPNFDFFVHATYLVERWHRKKLVLSPSLYHVPH